MVHGSSRGALFVLAAVGAALLPFPHARAQTPPHVAGPGQVTVAALGTGLRGLTEVGLPDWELTFNPALLRATRGFDDGGRRTALSGERGLSSTMLGLYLERRLGPRWAISALSSFQHARLGVGPVAETTVGLGDTYLSVRWSERLQWGSVSWLATVRLPGSYSDGSVTGSRQTDVEASAVLATGELLPRVGAVAGAGYKLRGGSVKDEVTLSALVPVRFTESLAVLLAAAGAVPAGSGDIARNAVVARAGLRWRARPDSELLLSFNRTVLGRNVVETNAFSFGISAVF